MKYVSLLMLVMIAAAAEFDTCNAFKVDPYESGLLSPECIGRHQHPRCSPRVSPLYVTPALPGEGTWYWKDMPTRESGQPIIFKLEIEVSHSEHTLKLIENTFFGRRDVLHECKVGLGASDFRHQSVYTM